MENPLPVPTLPLIPQSGQQAPIELEVGLRIIDAAFSKLKRILAGAHGESFTIEENLHIHDTIYAMCNQWPPHKYSEHLYELYKIILEDYTKSVVQPSLKGKHGEFLLRELAERWKNHKVMVRWLSRQFSYLNRTYVERSVKLILPLKELGMSCFYDLVFNQMKSRVATMVINMIDDERDGQLIDRALLKDVVDIYRELGRGSLGLYKLYFEPMLYKRTADYYSKKAQTWILEDSCAEYMIKVEDCLQKEEERVVHYLHLSTKPKLIEVAKIQLIDCHAELILNKENSGCRVLLQDGKTTDMSRMFRLFSKMEGGLSQVSKLFKEHVNEEGMSLLKHVTDTANSKKVFAERVIELHNKHMTFVTSCFQNDATFRKALTEAFEIFCNSKDAGCSCADSLAAFSHDLLLKGGSGKLSYEVVEETLDKVMEVLTYISDKDLYLELLRKMLGKRLLLYRNTNYDQERSLLSRVKLCLGGVSTSKMEVMLSDMTAAKEDHGNFQAYTKTNHPESVPTIKNMSVAVLKTGSWPSYENFDFNLPAEMAIFVEIFKNYYKCKHKDRKLTWIYSMGSCSITAKFDTKTVELIGTTYQAALLLLFNEADKISCAEIVTQLKLPHDEVVPLLKSLRCAKCNIIEKMPNTETISPTDIFQLNQKFTDKRGKIQLPLPPSAEKKNASDVVKFDRKYVVDACIVRVMKSRKAIEHSELVAECIEQLRCKFKPDVILIKKRIDDLISREYIERDLKDRKIYRYI